MRRGAILVVWLALLACLAIPAWSDDGLPCQVTEFNPATRNLTLICPPPSVYTALSVRLYSTQSEPEIVFHAGMLVKFHGQVKDKAAYLTGDKENKPREIKIYRIVFIHKGED